MLGQLQHKEWRDFVFDCFGLDLGSGISVTLDWLAFELAVLPMPPSKAKGLFADLNS